MLMKRFASLCRTGFRGLRDNRCCSAPMSLRARSDMVQVLLSDPTPIALIRGFAASDKSTTFGKLSGQTSSRTATLTSQLDLIILRKILI